MRRIVVATLIWLTAWPVFAGVMPSEGDALASPRVEHVLWDKMPIAFVVPEGQERLLIFPGRVKLLGSQNMQLTQDLVSVLNNSGTLYIKAKKAFDPIRVPVELTETGEVILVDFSSKPNADDVPVEVVLKEKEDNHEESDAAQVDESTTLPLLMRYVAQRTCAECGPKSAEEPLEQVVRSPMNTSRFVNLFNHVYNVTCMPIASWKSGHYYATAVRIKNLSDSTIRLKPQAVNGNWLAATFLPDNVLKPSGKFDDRLTVILASDQPFGSALNQTRGYFYE